MKILIAEDDEIVQLLLQAYCSNLDINCHIVSNGEEAIAALLEDTFDLVILDCQMPVLDGWKTVQLIKSQDLLPKGKKVVAFSAGTRQEERQRCFDAGFDEFMVKPVKPKEFQDVVFRLTGLGPCPSTADSQIEISP